MYTGAGELFAEQHVIADYWYRWADGHEVRFHLAVCPRGQNGEPVERAGVAVLSARQDSENLVYSVVEPHNSPWSDFGAFGAVLPRASALASAWEPSLFALVDAVSAKETRLADRILSTGLGLN